MDAARILRDARRRSGLTQRQLASRAGVRQPVVARVESGSVVPRADSLDRLLAGCGEELIAVPRPGRGLDRTMIRSLLDLSPSERARLAVGEARNLDRIDREI